jgi:hypothetical protein
MKRILLMGLVLAAVGCQLPPEQDTYRPLREHGQRLNYNDLVLRARRQAELANTAFYANNWGDLQDLSRALAQTADLLPTAADRPAVQLTAVRKTSAALARDASQVYATVRGLARLGADEREKTVKEINALLTGIQNAVRTLPRGAALEK